MRFSGQSPVLDSRCYLEGGGSAESFLASEDMQVGSIIGKDEPTRKILYILAYYNHNIRAHV